MSTDQLTGRPVRRPTGAASKAFKLPVGAVQTFNGGRKLVLYRTGPSLVCAPIVELLHATHLLPRRIIIVDGRAASVGEVAALVRGVEREEGCGVDILLDGSRKGAVRPVGSGRVGSG